MKRNEPVTWTAVLGREPAAIRSFARTMSWAHLIVGMVLLPVVVLAVARLVGNAQLGSGEWLLVRPAGWIRPVGLWLVGALVLANLTLGAAGLVATHRSRGQPPSHGLATLGVLSMGLAGLGLGALLPVIIVLETSSWPPPPDRLAIFVVCVLAGWTWAWMAYLVFTGARRPGAGQREADQTP